MSERIAKPFRCAECGALVHRARPRPDAMWAVRYGVEVPMPPDVPVPTCGYCGEWFVDHALAKRIQQRLEEIHAPPSAERTA